MEEWKSIPGWSRHYQASSTGRIRSRDRLVPARGGGVASRPGRVLKLVVKGGRYLCVTLANGESRKQLFVHDLVALAFKGKKPKGLVTRHLNDDKTNNTAANLLYGTPAENEADRKRNGKVVRGSDHGKSKLTEESVIAIRASRESPSALGLRYGVHPSHIHAVRTRKVWSHI